MPRLDSSSILDFVRNQLFPNEHLLDLRLKPLRGGLESGGVWTVRARFREGWRWFVVKQTQAFWDREKRVYREILLRMRTPMMPSLLGVEEVPGGCRLYLEIVRPATPWPWRENVHTLAIMRYLAALHQTALPEDCRWLAEWDYQAELAERARDTLKFAENCGLQFSAGSLAALRRMVLHLPRWRAELLEFAPLGKALIHGDVHPGNVIMRRRRAGLQPVFLDWARSRVGSPLEDVSSWLQSLGYWEPEARRRHDTLLRGYLRAIGYLPGLSRELREAYWLAAASNILSGALLYHLSVATAVSQQEDRRVAALRAAGDCFRVIRRADASWNAG